MTRAAALVSGFLLLSLALRLGFSAFFYSHPGNVIGVDQYIDLAVSILERGEYSSAPGQPSIKASPLFPLWIALLYFLFGKNPFILLAANSFLSTATGGIIFLLGRRLVSKRAGLMALGMWAFYPFAVYYCGWTFRDTFLTFLSALDLWLMTLWFENPSSKKKSAACAIAGAALGLTNPSSLLFVGLAPLGLLLLHRFRATSRSLAVYYLVLMLAYSPWPIRNQMAFGSPILTNQHGGMNLYYGLVIPPDALGTPEETRIRNSDPVELEARALDAQGKFMEEDRLYKSASFRLILAHPFRYAAQCWGRVLKFWRPVPYQRNYPFGYWKIFWASLLSDGLIIPLALLGIWTLRAEAKKLVPIYAALILWPLAYYLTYAVLRFRLPVMPFLVLLAAAFLDRKTAKLTSWPE